MIRFEWREKNFDFEKVRLTYSFHGEQALYRRAKGSISQRQLEQSVVMLRQSNPSSAS
jgi:hypothetical protein